MTHADRRPVFRRPALVLLACLLALASTLGLRPPAASADVVPCVLGQYTIIPTGDNGHELTQPLLSLVHLGVYTPAGDLVPTECGGASLTFTWTYAGDYFNGSGNQVSVAGTVMDGETITYQLRVTSLNFLVGWGQVTLTYVDAGPYNTVVTVAPQAPDAGQTVTLSRTTSSYAQLRPSTWDFGDGTPQASGDSVDHVYQSPGDYTTSVSIPDEFGKVTTVDQPVHVRAPLVGGFTLSSGTVGVGDTVSVEGSAQTAEPGATIIGYSWDFGDGHSATGATADHAYTAAGTYTITETVTDSLDRTAVATRDVTVQDVPADTPPVAAWQVTTPAPEAGSPTAFDGSGSTDDGTITGYSWDFGDGHTGTSATPEHVYDAAGTYTVVLTVTDDAGLTDSVTHNVTVADTPVSPTAAFTVNPASPVAGSPITFDAGSSTEPGGALTDYSWAFGDGSTASGVSQPHTYLTAGTYQATLTVTDSRGMTATAVRSVTVHWKPTDLAVSVSGSTPKVGLYTYRVTVRNLGSAAAHGVVLLNTPDKTQVLASAPSAPAGVSCAGVRIGSTGTITCKAGAATVLGGGKAWTVTYTVTQPHLARPRLATETSQVTASNPDPVPTNNVARLGTTVGAVL